MQHVLANHCSTVLHPLHPFKPTNSSVSCAVPVQQFADTLQAVCKCRSRGICQNLPLTFICPPLLKPGAAVHHSYIPRFLTPGAAIQFAVLKMQGTSKVLCLSTGYPYNVLSLTTEPEVCCQKEQSLCTLSQDASFQEASASLTMKQPPQNGVTFSLSSTSFSPCIFLTECISSLYTQSQTATLQEAIHHATTWED
jgi:hypothetical protein